MCSISGSPIFNHGALSGATCFTTALFPRIYNGLFRFSSFSKNKAEVVKSVNETKRNEANKNICVPSWLKLPSRSRSRLFSLLCFVGVFPLQFSPLTRNERAIVVHNCYPGVWVTLQLRYLLFINFDLLSGAYLLLREKVRNRCSM